MSKQLTARRVALSMYRVCVTGELQERVDVFRRKRALLLEDVSAQGYSAVELSPTIYSTQAARGIADHERDSVRVHVSILTPQQGGGRCRFGRLLVTDCKRML